jgi:hypothetical protein
MNLNLKETKKDLGFLKELEFDIIKINIYLKNRYNKDKLILNQIN